ncbi:ATP-grasp domain-containing protein [Psychrobacillus sp. NEAU-3TGS]|uniref:ATP-grasp domain-containing protein n=1 Tax=Psychrobacillus sp. NEAU-3TGS TaxID=2995412 RepID=UPI002495B9B4|nr:ATP-grasp domain-containing protein [Psychrobacillus sp. NEAU-3TGS]MDI2586779.1 ATP-grasp domain-containing protein [Psychrobacillus sp. NEAU-3TGS]
MSINIWFNRWFSTVAHYMEMIRHNSDQQEFVIYGTHPNPDTVYFNYCDVSGTEPDIEGEAYLQFCIDYCIQNQIHVFVPRKENVLISQNLDKFEEIGVKVLVCPDGDLMALVDDKAAMYRSLQDQENEGNFIVAIPSYRIVNNAKEFQAAYEALSQNNTKLCIKPVIGEGASGFRIIDNKADTIPFIFSTASSQKISYDTAIKILKTQEHFPDLMVLEYLDGYEYSIDCLAEADGTLLTAIPRKKGNGRIREIEYNKELIEIAEKMAAQYKIPYVFNIQVRYKDGIPKLLEINPRMSGGLHISCLSDINFPYYAIKLLLGEQLETLDPRFDVKATHIEQPVILSSSKDSVVLV